MTRRDLIRLKKLSVSINEFVEIFEEFIYSAYEKEQTSTEIDQVLGLFPSPPSELFSLNKTYALKCLEIAKIALLNHPDSKRK